MRMWTCEWWRTHIWVLQFSFKTADIRMKLQQFPLFWKGLSTRFWNLAAGIFSHLSTRALVRLGHWQWVIKPGSFKPCFSSLSWRWWIRLWSGIRAHWRSLPPGNISLWTLLCAQGHCHVEWGKTLYLKSQHRQSCLKCIIKLSSHWN